MLSPVEDGPGDATRVLSLQEQGFGFAILEAEDLAVATDVELTLEGEIQELVETFSFGGEIAGQSQAWEAGIE